MNKFDYKGYSEEELLQLCDDNLAYKGKAKWHYWTAEVYSFGRHIRNYAFYPSFLPLHIYTDHGPGCYITEIPKHEFEHDASCQFYHSADSVKLFKKSSDKPCYTMLSPFAWCRKVRKIQQSDNARGTLAFPAHSTQDIDLVSDIEEYIEQLKKLPEEFQPVSVCLHMHDINKDQHKIFMKHNIPVYTAGNAFDQRFAERFYDILKNYKYTTSNMIGSYTYYSIEMGIPFSLYGKEAKYENKGNANMVIGEMPLNLFYDYYKISETFKGLYKIITEDQKKIAEISLGINEGISRIEMAKLLYYAYFRQSIILKTIIYNTKQLFTRTTR